MLDATTVPVIGIGAGTLCHGQVLVLQDVLGMTENPPPFAVKLSDVGQRIEEAGRKWVELVSKRGKSGTAGEVVTKKVEQREA